MRDIYSDNEPSPEKLRKQVIEGLDNAKENGYFNPGEALHGETPEEITNDIMTYSDGLLEYKEEDILALVKEWLKKEEDNASLQS